MNVVSHRRSYLLIFSLIMTSPVWATADPSQQTAVPDRLTISVSPSDEPLPKEPPGSEMTERGRHIRGIYIPVAKVAHAKPKKFIQWLKNIGADAVVMDIKDDHGRVTFTKDLPLAKGSPHGLVPKMAALVEALKAEGIYTIGRLVCFKDNFLYKKHPESAIVDRRDGKPWRDRKGSVWSDPFSLTAHEHIAAIAAAAEKIGFDEIQLDYVRFPVDGETRYAKYPNKDPELARYQVIQLLLARVDYQISTPLSIDVFGLTVNRIGDPQGLGQSLEHLAPFIDAVSPMLYLANQPEEIWATATLKMSRDLVYNAVKRIRARLSDQIAIRPLLQGFEYRASFFGVDFIYGQVEAATSGGAGGHLFWNQGGFYPQLARAWKRSLPDAPVSSETSVENAKNTLPSLSEPEQDAGVMSEDTSSELL
jgi:hypothetical protein